MILLVMPLAFIRLPAKINPGIESNTKTSSPAYIFCGMTNKGKSENRIYTNEANPKANAMGKPIIKSRRKTMNKMMVMCFAGFF